MDTTRYYTMAPASVEATTSAATKRVSVRVSLQSEYLRRPAIAVRVTPTELRLGPTHRWAERLDEGVARVVAQALQAARDDVVAAPAASSVSTGPRTEVEITLIACEGTADGAVLEAYWKIHPPPGAGDAASGAAGHFRRVRGGWDGSDYAALAEALGALAGQLAQEIAAAL